MVVLQYCLCPSMYLQDIESKTYFNNVSSVTLIKSTWGSVNILVTIWTTGCEPSSKNEI